MQKKEGRLMMKLTNGIFAGKAMAKIATRLIGSDQVDAAIGTAGTIATEVLKGNPRAVAFGATIYNEHRIRQTTDRLRQQEEQELAREEKIATAVNKLVNLADEQAKKQQERDIIKYQLIGSLTAVGTIASAVAWNYVSANLEHNNTSTSSF
jgi:deoxyhypusine synthase